MILKYFKRQILILELQWVTHKLCVNSAYKKMLCEEWLNAIGSSSSDNPMFTQKTKAKAEKYIDILPSPFGDMDL